MENKRQVNGTKYNVSEIVSDAIAAVDGSNLNTEKARQALVMMGHRSPDDALVVRYARETAILDNLACRTGANFGNQIGKIDFSSTEKTTAGVESYLNRRIAGQHARWTTSHKGY